MTIWLLVFYWVNCTKSWNGAVLTWILFFDFILTSRFHVLQVKTFVYGRIILAVTKVAICNKSDPDKSKTITTAINPCAAMYVWVRCELLYPFQSSMLLVTSIFVYTSFLQCWEGCQVCDLLVIVVERADVVDYVCTLQVVCWWLLCVLCADRSLFSISLWCLCFCLLKNQSSQSSVYLRSVNSPLPTISWSFILGHWSWAVILHSYRYLWCWWTRYSIIPELSARHWRHHGYRLAGCLARPISRSSDWGLCWVCGYQLCSREV